MVTQTYDLNLIPGGQIVNVHVSQYDIGRTITFNLLNGASVFSVPSGTTALIEGTKPDKKGFSLTATASGSTASFTTTQNMCAAAGKTICEIRLKQGTRNIGTANFILEVERAGLADDVDLSTSELAPYMDAARKSAEAAEKSATNAATSATAAANSATESSNRARDAANSATAAAKSATDAANSAVEAAESAERAGGINTKEAEAWAVGQKDGVDVGPDDKTYRNNSKYYAGVAQDAAELALFNLGDAGYIGFRIDENGHLIMTKSANLTYLDFYIADHKDLVVTISDTSEE